jgi:prevent-host-death family protein
MFELKGNQTIASATEVQRDFGRVIDKVREQDVVIIRNNMPVAVLVGIDRFVARDADPSLPVAARYFVALINTAPAHLQARIVSVMLYGSYARGEQHAGSDVDLLVLANDEELDLQQQISAWSIEAMARTEYQDFLVAIVRTERYWQEQQRLGILFAREVQRDGKLLWKNSTSS